MVKFRNERGPKFATIQKQPLSHPNIKGFEEVIIIVGTYWVQGGTKRTKTTKQLGLRK